MFIVENLENSVNSCFFFFFPKTRPGWSREPDYGAWFGNDDQSCGVFRSICWPVHMSETYVTRK